MSKKYLKPFANRDPDDLVTSEEYAKAIGSKSADSLRQRKYKSKRKPEKYSFPPHTVIGNKMLFRVGDLWEYHDKEVAEQSAKAAAEPPKEFWKFVLINNVLETARDEARKSRHRQVTPEHLLLVLLHDPDARPMLERRKVNFESLRTALYGYLSDHQEQMPGSATYTPDPADQLEHVVKYAKDYFSSRGSKYKKTEPKKKEPKGARMPTGEHLIAAVRNVEGTFASKVLIQHGVRRFRIPLIIWDSDEPPAEKPEEKETPSPRKLQEGEDAQAS